MHEIGEKHFFSNSGTRVIVARNDLWILLETYLCVPCPLFGTASFGVYTAALRLALRGPIWRPVNLLTL